MNGFELAERGANSAALNAGQTWQSMAAASLVIVAESSKEFTSEDVKGFAYRHLNLPKPPDDRAWGAVFLKARKNNYIRKIGYRSLDDPKCHARPGAVWAKA